MANWKNIKKDWIKLGKALSPLGSLISNPKGAAEFITGKSGKNNLIDTVPPEIKQLIDFIGQMGKQGVEQLGPQGQRPIYNQQTMDALQQIQQTGLGALGDIGPLAHSAARMFQERTLPPLTQYFGSQGGVESSGFQQALANALAGSQERLQDVVNQRSIGLLPQTLTPTQEYAYSPLQLVGAGLSNQVENKWMGGHPSRIVQLLEKFGPTIAKSLGASFGVPGL